MLSAELLVCNRLSVWPRISCLISLCQTEALWGCTGKSVGGTQISWQWMVYKISQWLQHGAGVYSTGGISESQENIRTHSMGRTALKGERCGKVCLQSHYRKLRKKFTCMIASLYCNHKQKMVHPHFGCCGGLTLAGCQVPTQLLTPPAQQDRGEKWKIMWLNTKAGKSLKNHGKQGVVFSP